MARKQRAQRALPRSFSTKNQPKNTVFKSSGTKRTSGRTKRRTRVTQKDVLMGNFTKFGVNVGRK